MANGEGQICFFLNYLSQPLKKFFELNNNGNHERDFTYVEDVCEILLKVMKKKLIKNMMFIIFAQITQ